MSDAKPQDTGMVRIVLGGDVVPTASNRDAFLTGDVSRLVDDGLRGVLGKADFRIINLEVPLTNEEAPIEKCGPALIAPAGSARGLAELGVDAVALANNHIMDQGAGGLKSTISALEGAGIRYFGAGESLPGAGRPLIVDVGGRRLGLYACAEHEFSIAGDDFPGANPFDPMLSLVHVKRLGDGCDVVVVLYHGGKEHYRYPSPLLRERCRALVDSGADVVVCQHSHCIGCEEVWHGGTIVYGQGNFLFDYQDNEFWATGILVEVCIGGSVSIKYHPIVKNGASVRLARNTEVHEIMGGFRERSEQIKMAGFVEEEYGRFARSNLNGYLSAIMPGARSFPFRVLNRLYGGNLAEKLCGRQLLLTLRNYVECEAHNELFVTGIRAALGDWGDGLG